MHGWTSSRLAIINSGFIYSNDNFPFSQDFILRSDQSLQINTLTQISIILMYVLRIKFNPICLIEDILGAWIDLLVVVPIEVTSVIVIRNHSKM